MNLVHENSVIDLTKKFDSGNPERQVLESNRKRQDSNYERQKVQKLKKKTLENESISKHFNGQPLQSESESELLLVTPSNVNHSPGPVMRKVSP